MVHILQCPAAQEHFQFGPQHEFGQNFSQLGIVEHPWPIIRHRLHVDRAADSPCATFDRPDHYLSVWTDGSVFWSECFPLTAAGYSIINEDGSIFDAGTVSHLALSSFSAELWAVVMATLKADCCLCVYSDCQEVVAMVNLLVQRRCIPRNCLHLEWWQTLLAVINLRSLSSDGPVLTMVWIPAHIDDALPISLIPAVKLQQAGTTRKHVELNRVADKVAKYFALQRCAIAPRDKTMFQAAVLHQQEVLTQLNKFIGFECAEEFVDASSPPKPLCLQDFQKCYPGLAWSCSEQAFDLVFNIPDGPPPSKADLSHADWDQLRTFLKSLHWISGLQYMCTYQELAFFFTSGAFDCTNDLHTFKTLYCSCGRLLWLYTTLVLSSLVNPLLARPNV